MKILFLSVFILSGCATVHFRSNDEIPVSFSRNTKHTKKIVIKGVTKFYFGGALPKLNEIYIDKIVKKAGYSEISGLIIYEERSIKDLFLKIITLGIYFPTAYTFDGYTIENR